MLLRRRRKERRSWCALRPNVRMTDHQWLREIGMKSQPISSAFVIGVVAFAFAILVQGTQSGDPGPRLPAPSSPFGIGRVGYHWVDPLRPDGHSKDPNAHR